MSRQVEDRTLEMMKFIKKIVDEEAPLTQRHLFYRCVDGGFIEKDSSGEDKVSTVIFHMRWGVSRTALRGNRMNGYLPEPTIPDDLRLDWHDVVDETRRVDETNTWSGPKDRVEAAARNYRRSVLDNADTYVEVWVEKDALKSILWLVVKDYDVPLVSTRGQPSHPLMHDLAIRIMEQTAYTNDIVDAVNDRPVTLLVLTDYDPSGKVIAENFETVLTDFFRLFGLDPDTIFEEGLKIHHVALTRQLVDKYKLPTRPTKRGDNSHAHRFKDNQSVELDALRPNVLRALVRKEIERYVPQSLVAKVRAKQDRERKKLVAFAGKFQG